MHWGGRWLPPLVAGLAIACGGGSSAPPEGDLEALLREEAMKLKAEGEDVDPAFGVTANWEIDNIEIRERANDSAYPYAGSIRFQISSIVAEPDGSKSTEDFAKTFDFVWSVENDRWEIR